MYSLKGFYKIIVLLLVPSFILVGCDFFSDTGGGQSPAAIPALKNQLALQLAWKKTLLSSQTSTYMKAAPAIEGNRLFLADGEGKLLSASAKNGQINWSTKTKNHFVTPAVYGEQQLYLGNSAGELLAFSAANGAEKWKIKLSDQMLAEAAYAKGIVIVKTADGAISAFSSKNGQALWQYKAVQPELLLQGQGAPIVTGNKVLLGLSTGELLALNLQSGEFYWDQQLADPQGFSEIERMVDVNTTPVVDDTCVYVATYQGNIVALNLQSGEILWQHPFSSYSGLTVDKKYLFATDSNGVLWAFNKRTGSIIWKQSLLRGYMLTSPTLFKDDIFVADNSGFLTVFSIDTGEPLARMNVGKKPVYVPPFIIDQHIFILSSDGQLMMIGRK